MTAHLLPLSVLHAAAPGVLDVIFGPDGSFEGAPQWRTPLYMLVGRRFVDDWQRTEDVVWLDLPPHGLVAHGQVALDLRIPSVAARLAGLCARALNETGDGWRVGRVGPLYILTDGLTPLQWTLDGYPLCLYGPRLPAPFVSDLAFLAALTLALAPRIVALRGTR